MGNMVTTIIMWILFAFAVFLYMQTGQGAELSQNTHKGVRLLDVDYIGLEYKKHENYRDPYFPEYETVSGECTGYTVLGTTSDECMSYGAAALFDLSLIRKGSYGLVWRNILDMDATNKQVRQVGWDWELGFLLGPKIELFHRHHSRHVLEDARENRTYPLRDEVVVRFNLYRSK
jgi:hypothetical protein